MEYEHNNTSVVMVNYHIVFCPKYRRKLLVGKIKDRLQEVFDSVAMEQGWKIISSQIMPDHVHLFVGADTTTRPKMVVKKIQGKVIKSIASGIPRTSKDAYTMDSFIFPFNCG